MRFLQIDVNRLWCEFFHLWRSFASPSRNRAAAAVWIWKSIHRYECALCNSSNVRSCRWVFFINLKVVFCRKISCFIRCDWVPICFVENLGHWRETDVQEYYPFFDYSSKPTEPPTHSTMTLFFWGPISFLKDSPRQLKVNAIVDNFRF